MMDVCRTWRWQCLTIRSIFCLSFLLGPLALYSITLCSLSLPLSSLSPSALTHYFSQLNKILKLSPTALNCWLIPSASSQNVFIFFLFLDWETPEGLGWPRKCVPWWAPWATLFPPSRYLSWFSPTQLVAQMPGTILSYRSRGWAVVSMTTTHTWISEVMCAQRKEQAGHDDIHVSCVCNAAGTFP